MRQKPEPNHAQLALPLQRERRTRTPIPPFVCIDPNGIEPAWNGEGRPPQYAKQFKAENGVWPVAHLLSREERNQINERLGTLADAVIKIFAMLEEQERRLQALEAQLLNGSRREAA